MVIIDLVEAVKELRRNELNFQFIPGGFYAAITECLYFMADPAAVIFHRESLATKAAKYDFNNNDCVYTFGDELVSFIEDSFSGFTRSDIIDIYNTGDHIETVLRTHVSSDVLDKIKGRVREIERVRGDVVVIHLR